ncbi:acetate/propionate family kinase [Variovorax sp. J22P240]|uniref:acetate/propionate family kinase n=1 Tax=unclassified Variovorax TaxID=663243 RepID=UPI002575C4B2|nr:MULTISPECIES: acetate/propionate family kinase [unclassified Variovorax]MDL9997511.1 acetate/propionate family kinase [Variovorax sp. J22P240]MDM0051547.1 acetate/propionate family kinase [Variovorax sp. J22R115]
MSDAIVVLNAGSSSLKFSLFAGMGDLPFVAGGQVSGLYTAAPRFVGKDAAGKQVAEKRWDADAKLDHHGAIVHIVEWLRSTHGHEHRLAAVGHRVVHGGMDYAAPVRVDSEVVARLEKLVPLAPLHQPHNLEPIRALLQRAPDLPQVACFDTAAHRSNPPVAQMFALPKEFSDAGVRRYGFHGLSYEYIASVLPKFDARAASGKTVVLHLGNGASMCALLAGHSVASTMGFTAVDGLPMGTRCGALDPGVILYLMDERGMDARAIEKLIYSQSGLLGVSGVSSDMRELLESDRPQAKVAVDLFIYRIGRELGSLAAALGGLDAIVFTAGIGEHATVVRERICRQAAWLGIELDPDANASRGPCISKPGSRVAAWVIPTNEELMIARHTRDLLARG